jgi:hypothetical protein
MQSYKFGKEKTLLQDFGVQAPSKIIFFDNFIDIMSIANAPNSNTKYLECYKK